MVSYSIYQPVQAKCSFILSTQVGRKKASHCQVGKWHLLNSFLGLKYGMASGKCPKHDHKTCLLQACWFTLSWLNWSYFDHFVMSQWLPYTHINWTKYRSQNAGPLGMAHRPRKNEIKGKYMALTFYIFSHFNQK